MGKWAKFHFGEETFSEIGIVVAGAIDQKHKGDILDSFDKVISGREDMVFHTSLAEKGGVQYPVLFNVFGTAEMLDGLALMHDGGCRTVIFVGSAYGFKNLAVGSIVIPNKSYHFEEIYNRVVSERKAGIADEHLKQKLADLFDREKIDYVTGTNVSVPAVTFKPPLMNQEYKKIQPLTLEMELSACYSRAKEIGIRAVGVLVISDNHNSRMGDKTVPSIAPIRIKILQAIMNNIVCFTVPPLATTEEFNIDKYFDSISEDLMM